jgi:hypothetical protein
MEAIATAVVFTDTNQDLRALRMLAHHVITARRFDVRVAIIQ